MLFLKSPHTDIILLLSKKPHLSVREIHEALRGAKVISLPQLYKVLDELIGNSILIKDDHLFRLNPYWLHGLEMFTEETKKIYKDVAVTQKTLSDGESIVVYALGFRAFETIMVEQYLSLKQDIDLSQPIYYYNSHAYFPLTSPDPTHEIMRTFTTTNESYGIIGNNSVPDQYAVENDTMQGYQTVIHEKTPFLKEGYCVVVQDEYIFEVLFPALISNHFRIIFEASTSMEQFNYEHYQQILDIKAKYKITVRRNKKEAQQLKKVMQKLYEEGAYGK